MILERVAGGRFSRVLPLWSDYPVVLLGGGPSLTVEQFEMVRAAREDDAVRVIAINDSYLLAPWADVVYFADAKWVTWHAAGVAKPKLGLAAEEVRGRWINFRGQKCGIQSAEPYHPADVHVLRIANVHQCLSRDPGALATGRQDGYSGHSGFQALNLATLAGGKTHILLGFDGRPGADGRTHFHGAHAVQTPAEVWPYIARSFSCIENELKAAGIRVINCSPWSGIDSFPKMGLHAALIDTAFTSIARALNRSFA